MKAAYYTGDKTFTIREDEPKAPKAGQVRVQIAYCGICGTDLHVFHGSMDKRVTTNRVIGHECSGIVAEIGEGVEGFEVGDKVVIRPLDWNENSHASRHGNSHVCEDMKFLGLDTEGAFQNFWTVPARTLFKIPADMRLDYAALMEPTAVACHDVKRARVKAGEDVLVIGGGPIGLLVAMVAKAAGGNVTISEVSEYRLETARKLGFNTINPMNEDVVAKVMELTDGKGVEVVFEVSGSKAGIATMTEVAAVCGRICVVAIFPNKPEVDMFKFFWRELELLGARLYTEEDYKQAIELVISGGIDCESLITDIQDLEDITKAFQALDGNATAMKSLIKCS